ncbi:hypothetical protein DVA67_009335 [Solirubrobacter sp. CPCC 204708]|uniref:Uncharacterized protein n=1 Tax=Solirubrobacter deserti TaxID=2282478 RepID=A0ABT4RT95_9ACTN|nr:hypothetical protein [Solirubrobacter deserti]MBE2316177.1 hypothetical protein [Solirubrobacter deserti]MDA0141803.1 hypothetical protein [Solirubrobacter deserti]
MKRVMALGAAALAVGAGAAAYAHKATAGGAAAAQADGGLAVSSGTIDAPAKAGAYGPIKVSNRSASALTVTVAPRQWTQAADGKVSPNRRGGLAGVSVSAPSFTLQPGEERELTVSVASLPAAGSLFGALEVVGLPADVATRKGVVLGYRVVSAIRLKPAAPKLGVTAGTIKASKGTAVLPIKSTGNTLDPVSGTIAVKDSRGTRNLSVPATKILPGKTINVPLGTKLQKGSATAKITLRQKGKVALSLTKKFTVK